MSDGVRAEAFRCCSQYKFAPQIIKLLCSLCFSEITVPIEVAYFFLIIVLSIHLSVHLYTWNDKSAGLD